MQRNRGGTGTSAAVLPDVVAGIIGSGEAALEAWVEHRIQRWDELGDDRKADSVTVAVEVACRRRGSKDAEPELRHDGRRGAIAIEAAELVERPPAVREGGLERGAADRRDAVGLQ
eukprot:7386039-Prymnesium_polylepis.2